MKIQQFARREQDKFMIVIS